MATEREFRIRAGFGPHTVGQTTYYAGQVFKSSKNLTASNPKKFEEITAGGNVVARSSAWGTEVTEEFPAAGAIAGLKVFLKGRRYRLTLHGSLVDTDPGRLHNHDQVNENIEALKTKKKGEAELDDSEVDEDEDESEDESGAEEEAETEAEGEDDALVGKPKKKKKSKE